MGVLYTLILVEGFRSVANFSRGWKPRLKVASDLKPDKWNDRGGFAWSFRVDCYAVKNNGNGVDDKQKQEKNIKITESLFVRSVEKLENLFVTM